MATTFKRPFKFSGKGGELFEIFIVNLLLRIITLNFYYPWAKVRKLKYVYSKIDLFGSPVSFHAKGKELFIGYIKSIILFTIIYAPLLYAIFHPHEKNLLYYGLGIFYIGIFSLIPLAIHGTLKYRMAKTGWRGIRFGYRGELSALYKKFFVGIFLTIITFGIYGAWFTVDIRKYVIHHLRMGDVRFSFTGRGSDLFIIFLKGLFFIPLTLGIYTFWYYKEVFNFFSTHTRVHQGDKILKVKGTTTGLGFVELLVVNYFIVTLSFGLGAPWAIIRTVQYYLQNIEMEEGFNPDIITQTEKEYNDALAEDLSDILDIGLI